MHLKIWKIKRFVNFIYKKNLYSNIFKLINGLKNDI